MAEEKQLTAYDIELSLFDLDEGLELCEIQLEELRAPGEYERTPRLSPDAFDALVRQVAPLLASLHSHDREALLVAVRMRELQQERERLRLQLTTLAPSA